MAEYVITYQNGTNGSAQMSNHKLAINITTTTTIGVGTKIDYKIYCTDTSGKYDVGTLYIYLGSDDPITVTGSKYFNNIYTGSKQIDYVGEHDAVKIKIIPKYSVSIYGSYKWNGYGSHSNKEDYAFSYDIPMPTSGTKPTDFTVTSPTNSIISETSESVTVTWSSSTSYNNEGSYRLDVKKNSGTWETVSDTISFTSTSYDYKIDNSQGNTYEFRMCATNIIGSTSFFLSGKVEINSLSPPTISSTNPSSKINPYVNSSLVVNINGGSQTNSQSFKRYARAYFKNKSGVVSDIFSCTTPSSNGNTSATISIQASKVVNHMGSNSCSAELIIEAWIQNSNGSKSNYDSTSITIDINTDGGCNPTVPTDFIALSGGVLNNASSCFITSQTNKVIVTLKDATVQRKEGISPTITYKIESSSGFSCTGKRAEIPCTKDGTFTITATAIDSRSPQTTVTYQYVVQKYFDPIVKIASSARDTATETTAKITVEISYAKIYQYANGVLDSQKGNQLNDIIERNARIVGDETISNTFTGSEFNVLNLDESKQFSIYISVKDKLNNVSKEDIAIIPTTVRGFVMLNKRVGINCVPQHSKSLEVNGAIYSNDKIIRETDISETDALAVDKYNSIIEYKSLQGNTLSLLQAYHLTSGAFASRLVQRSAGRSDANMVQIGLVARDDSASYAYINKRLDITSGSLRLTEMNNGISFKDGKGNMYYSLYDNKTNLWIGSQSSSAKPHYGQTLISTGYTVDSSENIIPNASIKISIPKYNASSNSWTDEKKNVIHEGNLDAELLKRHPIGSIYITVSSEDFSNYLGGVWELFGKGRTLVSVDPNDDDFNVSEKTGGEKEHTLSLEEMPKHQHSYDTGGATIASGTKYNRPVNKYDESGNVDTFSDSDLYKTTFAGGGQPHNNMPPYITVYMWKRKS